MFDIRSLTWDEWSYPCYCYSGDYPTWGSWSCAKCMCFSIKLHSATQVPPRKTLSITHHALSPPPSQHHLYIIHLINWLQRLSYYNVTFCDVKHNYPTNFCHPPLYNFTISLNGHYFIMFIAMCMCFSIKLHSATQVPPRKTLSITHHALSPHLHSIICTSFISSIDYNVYRITMWPFVM